MTTANVIIPVFQLMPDDPFQRAIKEKEFSEAVEAARKELDENKMNGWEVIGSMPVYVQHPANGMFITQSMLIVMWKDEREQAPTVDPFAPRVAIDSYQMTDSNFSKTMLAALRDGPTVEVRTGNGELHIVPLEDKKD